MFFLKDMKAFVFETYDVDCDGIGYGYHYFEGEAGTGEEAVQWFLSQDRCVPMGVEAGGYCMPLTTFFTRAKLSGFDRDYFIEEGYFGVFHSRWH